MTSLVLLKTLRLEKVPEWVLPSRHASLCNLQHFGLISLNKSPT